MERAKDYLLERIGSIKLEDGEYFDADETVYWLTEYDHQMRSSVKYEVTVNATYRSAFLEFKSPYEATNFMRMWAEHLTINEDEFSLSLRVSLSDETAETN